MSSSKQQKHLTKQIKHDAHKLAVKEAKREVKDKMKNSFLGTAAGAISNAFIPGTGALATKAGNWFSKLVGLGEYKIKQNSLFSGINGDNPTPLDFAGKDHIDIIHKEYIADIVASSTFSSTSYVINPGNPITFPWLSSVANAYEQYQLKGMFFNYKSVSGEAVSSTNSSIGEVIFATQYNMYAEPFTDKAEMLASEFSNECPADTKCMYHPIECASNESAGETLYTKSNTASTYQDARFSDYGLLTVAVQGCQADNFTIGELWATYHIRLLKPRKASSDVYSVPYFHVSAASTSSAVPLQSSGTVNTYYDDKNTLRPTITDTTLSGRPSSKITFSNNLVGGRYRLIVMLTIEGSFSGTPTGWVATIDDSTSPQAFYNMTGSQTSTSTAFGGTTFISVSDININSTLNAISGSDTNFILNLVSPVQSSGTLVNWDVRIVKVPKATFSAPVASVFAVKQQELVLPPPNLVSSSNLHEISSSNKADEELKVQEPLSSKGWSFVGRK